MTALRLVVFDCDGTLVDSQHAILAAMSQAFLAAGVPQPEPGAVRRMIGLPLEEVVRGLLPEPRRALEPVVTAAYKEAFFTLRHRPDHVEPLFPGLDRVLDRLEAAGAVLAIATGKARRGLLATLERHGLERRFATLHTADDGPGKPAPDMVLAAMRASGAAPAGTVMVGDTTFDVQMARAAGVDAIAVGWGYHPGPALVAAGAVALADDADALIGAIARRWARADTGTGAGAGNAPRL